MRPYPQIYPGDSSLQTGTVLSNNARTSWNSAISETSIVHGIIGAEQAPGLEIDLAAIEAQARAARSAWIGSKLKSFYEALVRKFARGGEAEMENYLAASHNLADLDERIRRYERMQLRYY